MTDSTLTSPVAAGTALATDVVSNVHIPKNLLVNAAREAVNPATSEDIADVVAALEAGSFPTDLATEETLAAVLAKLIAAPATEAGQASILAKIIAAPATEAKQDTVIGHVDGIETLLTQFQPFEPEMRRFARHVMPRLERLRSSRRVPAPSLA